MAETENLVCREYATKDKSACVGIFASLTPRYFRAGELKDFIAFLNGLDHDRCRFGVVEDADGKIIGCGGMWIEREKGVASLCWEMVHQENQGQGIGKFMLEARLRWLDEYPEINHVIASAAAHSSGFFTKQGFETYHVQSDYFGPGQDLHDMKLKIR